MNEVQLPAGMGRCTACKQAQPYTNRNCDICQTPLPWAVQHNQAPPSPFPPGQFPPNQFPPNQFPPGQYAPGSFPPPYRGRNTLPPPPANNGSKTVLIILGALGFVFVVLPICVIVLLSILGGRVKKDFDAAAQNVAMVAAAPAPGCGVLNQTECDWEKAFAVAIAPVDFSKIPGETFAQMCDRRSRQAFQAKANLRTLPPVPSRFSDSLALTFQAMDEFDAANQLCKKAVDSHSNKQIDEALDAIYNTIATFKVVAARFKAAGGRDILL